MAKYKNIVTGNVLEVTNKTAAELMRHSGRYKEITEAKTPAPNAEKSKA